MPFVHPNRSVLTYVRPLLLAAALLLAGDVFLLAQTGLGTIVGRVTDPSSAVIPNAKVVLRNEATNVSATINSNESGDFVFPNIIPGTYEVAFTAEGFKPYVISHVVIYVDQTVRENATLTVGSVSQSVNVTAELPLVQTQTSEVGGVVVSNQINEMPLNGRTSLWTLLQLEPGVQNAGSNPQIAGNTYIAGTGSTLDGVTFMETENERLSDLSPSLDAIAEFKVVDSSGSAENGAGAVQVTTSTKSGTNEFHGSAFEYNMVRALEAANFFATGLPKAPFIRNEYGGSLGGPIKKNKLFFFGSYEGYKYTTAVTAETAQPTPALLAGNFAGLPTITDPSTGLPFPSNQIPQGDISKVSSYFFKYFDTPNLASTAPAGLGTNYVVNIPNDITNNRWLGRVDYDIDSSNTLAGKYYIVRAIPQDLAWGATEKMNNVIWPYVVQGLSVNYTHIITPRLVNLATFGWDREWDTIKSQNYAFDPSTVIPGLPPGLPDNAGLPTFSIPGFYGISDWVGSGDWMPSFEFHDTLTWSKGSHMIKGGFSWFRWQFHNYQNPAPAHGTFSFTGRYTGNSFADFLLGDISEDGYPIHTLAGTPTNDRFGLWVQDSWKATSRLTVNLGLRYDLPTQFVNIQGNMANWYPDRNQLVAIKGTYQASLWPGLPIVSGSSVGIDTGNYTSNDLHQLSPRIGVAYTPFGTSRLVLRGGAGIYYNMEPWQFGSWLTGLNPPYDGSIYFEPAAGPTPTLTFANPFPTGAGSTPSGIGLSVLSQKAIYPASNEWNFTAESQLSPTTSVRATYVGNEANHLPIAFNINDPVPAPGPVQPRRPFQPFGPIGYYEDGSTSNCQELQLSVIRRVADGLSLQVEYAWTKWLTSQYSYALAPTDNQNLYLDRGNSPLIRPQYLVANYVYSLPFGAGKKLLSSAHGALNALVGGWQWTGILTLGSGLPFSVTFDSSTQGWPSNRADKIGNPHVSNPNLTQWFNPAAYAVPEPFTFGDSAPYSVFGPEYSNWDMGIFKVFKLKENLRLQFRSEWFNWLNHPSFSNPASDISVPSQVGQIYGTSNNPRSIQFALRLEF